MCQYVPYRKTGNCRTGYESNGGGTYHAVPSNGVWPGYAPALCGTKPRKGGNGWSSYPGQAVECPKCLDAIARAFEAWMRELRQTAADAEVPDLVGPPADHAAAFAAGDTPADAFRVLLDGLDEPTPRQVRNGVY